MPTAQSAEWILTFDDGPLPADITTWTPGQEDDLLQPLRQMLTTLQTHPEGPIPAVFYLRGKVYPWGADAPLDDVIHRGLDLIGAADERHRAELHCNSHEPDLWWDWLFRADDIHRDLDDAVAYFTPMLPRPMTAFRPPYGQGGIPGRSWAADRHFRWHDWDLDSEDWLHHPDASPLIRQYVGDPAGHLKHILSILPFRIFWNLFAPDARDILMHVNTHTASYLDQIIDCICDTTRDLGHEPIFTVPDSYLQS